MRKYEKEVWAYSLRNAVDHYKAEEGKVLTKLFQHGLDKKDIKKVMPLIIRIVKEVNSKSGAWQKRELKKYEDYFVEKGEQDKDLPILPGVRKNMIFRMAPFPSGAMHIGNMKTFLLNAMYAEKYDALLDLVMDDTIGSVEKPPIKEAYDLIESGFDWLGVKPDNVYYKSDRLDLYYKYARKLIEMGKAYVCSCTQEEFKKFKDRKKDCPHRDHQGVDGNMKAWREMFKPGVNGRVLRLMTSMQDKNPAFRDRVLFKTSDRKHPRTAKKVRVWPTLEMSWAIDDHDLNISHIIRGNDLMMETEMEKYIWKLLGWKEPTIIHTGLVKIDFSDGAKLSKSKAQKEVLEGKYSGWDDPRTWSPASLEKRGILADSVKDFVKEIGLNKQDVSVPIGALYAINKRLIDKNSNRYSFLEDPIKLKIVNQPTFRELEIPIHPDKEEKRNVPADQILISEKDFKKYKGKEIRLLHLYNVKLARKIGESVFTSLDNKKIQKINWISNGLKTRIRMPTGEWKEGLADPGVKDLKKGETIQFERFGFCKFDGKKAGKYEFWFAHK